jgi:hypothetical protein
MGKNTSYIQGEYKRSDGTMVALNPQVGMRVHIKLVMIMGSG